MRLRQCWRNTRSRSHSSTASRSAFDRMQRNFEPMRKQEEAWQRSELTDVTAKVVICEAFVEGRLEAPKYLARTGMISTSSQSTKNSGHGGFGVFPMRSHRHLRNWIPSHNSMRLPSWTNFWKPGSHNRSSCAGRSSPPLPIECSTEFLVPALAGVISATPGREPD